MTHTLPDEKIISTADDFAQYLQEIRSYPMLTAQQERSIAEACARGDEDAIRTMVNSNLRLVVSIAREYANRGIPLMDLIQEGSIGLLTAARKFDLAQNCRFSTYASQWIHQGMSRYILNNSGVIRMSRQSTERARKLMAATSAMQQEGLEPTPAVLALRTGIPEDKVTELLSLIPKVCSLDAPVGDPEHDALQMLLEDVQTPQPYEELVRRELTHTMNTLLGMLSPRQQQVLRLHFGMEDDTCHSLAEIGSILGISKERARQIEQQALEKLHKLGADLSLEEFLDE
jgi:RNA polymerase primary sigma factor